MWWMIIGIFLPITCLGNSLPSPRFIKDFAITHQLTNVLLSFETEPSYKSIEWEVLRILEKYCSQNILCYWNKNMPKAIIDLNDYF